MAFQDGAIQLTGCLGNLTFYKSQGRYLARTKNSITAARINSDPAFSRTRQHQAEFKRATLGTQLLRAAFYSMRLNCSDRSVTSRFNSVMMKIVKSDPVNPPGMRMVSAGELQLLNGFNFNDMAMLHSTFVAPLTVAIDRPAGKVAIDIFPFVPSEMMTFQNEATHFVLKAAAVTIDFNKHRHDSDFSVLAPLPCNDQLNPAIHFELNLKPATILPVFVLIGIEFFQSVNNWYYPLNKSKFNATAIVKIDY